MRRSNLRLMTSPRPGRMDDVRVENRAGWIPFAVGLILAGLWFWNAGSDTRELRALSAHERSGLYRRTLDTMTTICAGPSAKRVRNFCRYQAELLVQLPECKAECDELTRSYLTQAPR